MAESTIKKVTIEYGNRTIYLEGKDAEAWHTMCNSQAVFCHIHGHKSKPLPWKTLAPCQFCGGSHK